MFEHAAKLYQSALDEIVAAGLYKDERVLRHLRVPHTPGT